MESGQFLVNRLKNAMKKACAEEVLDGELIGDLNSLRPSFKDQLQIAGEKLNNIFLDEINKIGRFELSLSLSEKQIQELEQAIIVACALTRKQAVEIGAFISGTGAFPFETDQVFIKRQGLAMYRFPFDADVEQVADKKSYQIEFAPGDLGEVTSAGFWAPTWLVGDFDIKLYYCRQTWAPGEKPACFGLWVANRDTSFHCYAQHVSEGVEHHFVGAVMGRRPLCSAKAVNQNSGRFRIRRQEDLFTTWYAEEKDDWMLMDQIRRTPPEEMVFGAKIWAHGKCGPLKVKIDDLHIQGNPSEHQDPSPPFRQDPKCTIL